jgi:hypothetical protein
MRGVRVLMNLDAAETGRPDAQHMGAASLRIESTVAAVTTLANQKGDLR